MWQYTNFKRAITLTTIPGTRICFLVDDILTISESENPREFYNAEVVLRCGNPISVREFFDRIVELAYGPEEIKEEKEKKI